MGCARPQLARQPASPPCAGGALSAAALCSRPPCGLTTAALACAAPLLRLRRHACLSRLPHTRCMPYRQTAFLLPWGARQLMDQERTKRKLVQCGVARLCCVACQSTGSLLTVPVVAVAGDVQTILPLRTVRQLLSHDIAPAAAAQPLPVSLVQSGSWAEAAWRLLPMRPLPPQLPHTPHSFVGHLGTMGSVRRGLARKARPWRSGCAAVCRAALLRPVPLQYARPGEGN